VSGRDPERLRVVAHELRSPVAALASLAEAARATTDRTLLRRLVELASAAVRDLERILSDPELVSLRLEQVDVAALATAFAGPDVTVDGDGQRLVHADPTRLRQAIANLVANGLRHGTRVTIHVTGEDGHVVVAVSDDGPGVDTDIDPFAHGMSGAGSTGIGLWLARGIAEAHGGSLELADAPGAGARFRLVVPSASV
jgi:two-component system sensor histidine kinase BaeS